MGIEADFFLKNPLAILSVFPWATVEDLPGEGESARAREGSFAFVGGWSRWTDILLLLCDGDESNRE